MLIFMVLTEGKEKYWRMVADFTTTKTAACKGT